MAKQKKHPFFVIRARPLDQGGGGNTFYAPDGSITASRKKAEKFITRGDAEEFAKRKNIPFNATRYIDREEFTDSEVE